MVFPALHRQRFQDRLQITNPNPLAQQILQNSLQLARPQEPRHDFARQRRGRRPNAVQQPLDLLASPESRRHGSRRSHRSPCQRSPRPFRGRDNPPTSASSRPIGMDPDGPAGRSRGQRRLGPSGRVSCKPASRNSQQAQPRAILPDRRPSDLDAKYSLRQQPDLIVNSHPQGTISPISHGPPACADGLEQVEQVSHRDGSSKPDQPESRSRAFERVDLRPDHSIRSEPTSTALLAAPCD